MLRNKPRNEVVHFVLTPRNRHAGILGEYKANVKFFRTIRDPICFKSVTQSRISAPPGTFVVPFTIVIAQTCRPAARSCHFFFLRLMATLTSRPRGLEWACLSGFSPGLPLLPAAAGFLGGPFLQASLFCRVSPVLRTNIPRPCHGPTQSGYC